jgi:hypothetical protein
MRIEQAGAHDIFIIRKAPPLFKGPNNRFLGTDFARLCSLAGRNDNPIPARFLVPCLKIPALGAKFKQNC